MNERPVMNRLPQGDTPTRRAEMAAFMGLGVVGASLMLMAAADAARFAGNREGIVAALTAPVSTPAVSNTTELLLTGSSTRGFTNQLRPRTVPQASLRLPQPGSNSRKG